MKQQQSLAATVLFNLLLAMAWTLLVGELSPRVLVTGFVVGWVVLSLVRTGVTGRTYFTKARQVVVLVLSFSWQLIVANIELAYEVLTPRWRMRPRMVAVPLDADNDLAITILANMISLTPGTLSIDLTDDQRTLYVHAVFARDANQVIRQIKTYLEKPLLEVLK